MSSFSGPEMTWYISARGDDTENCGRFPVIPCKSLPYLLNVVNPTQNKWTWKIYGNMVNITENYEQKKKNWAEDILKKMKGTGCRRSYNCVNSKKYKVDTSQVNVLCEEIKITFVSILNGMSRKGLKNYLHQLDRACDRAKEVYVSLFSFMKTI